MNERIPYRDEWEAGRDSRYVVTGLDPDPLTVPEPDDNPPAVIAWGCLAGIAFVVIVGVLLLIAFRQPVAG